MTPTIFTQLLDSYDGIRKRAWKPIPLIEQEGGTMSLQQAQGEANKIINAVAQGGEPWISSTDERYQVVKEEGAGEGGANYVYIIAPQRHTRVLEQNKAGGWAQLPAFNASTPRSTKMMLVHHLMGDDPEERRSQPPAGDPLGNEEGEEGETAEGDEDAGEGATGAEGQPVAFTESERRQMALYLGRKKGLSEEDALEDEEVKAEIDKMEHMANNPNKRSKIWGAIVRFLGARSDYDTVMRQQALTCAATLASMANKVETHAGMKVIRAEDLTALEENVRKIVTIRGGAGDKGVFFGRGDVGRVPGFEDLQKFASKYDSRYGTTMGGFFNKQFGDFFDVRVVPVGEPLTGKKKSDISKYDHLTRRSTSIEAAGDKMINHYRGALLEDVMGCYVAALAGDKAKLKESLASLKKTVQDGATLANVDMDDLEIMLLSDEYDGIEAFQKWKGLGVGPQHFVREMLEQAAVHTAVMLQETGLKKSDIISVHLPRDDSETGHRPDLDIVVKPGTQVNFKYQDCVTVDEHGRDVIRFSLKNPSKINNDTEMGTGSLLRGYGTNVVHNATVNKLQGQFIGQILANGTITQRQANDMRAAMIHDRDLMKRYDDEFGGMTNINKANMKSYIAQLKKQPVTSFTSVKARKAYDDTMKDIDTLFKEGDLGQVALSIFQLERQRRAAVDDGYREAAVMNDTIISGYGFDNEIMMRGAPGHLSVGTNHEMFNDLARQVFGDGQVKMTRGSCSIGDEDGKSLWTNAIRAKSRDGGIGRKLIAASRMTGFGRQMLLRTVDAFFGQKVSIPENENGKPSTLIPILMDLPTVETDNIIRAGGKLIMMLHPFILKVKLNGEEYEGGYPSKVKALTALDIIRDIAKERGETLTANVEDHDSGRTIS